MFHRVTQAERERLLLTFCRAIAEMRKPEEAAKFITDLLSERESEMLSRRLHIAQLLIEGSKYDAIARFTGASRATIARVSGWLDMAGEGYRLVYERTQSYKRRDEDDLRLREAMKNPYSWQRIRKRYPLYFWPQLLLEEIVRTASERQKNAIREALNKIHKKTKVYRQLDRLLREAQLPKTTR